MEVGRHVLRRPISISILDTKSHNSNRSFHQKCYLIKTEQMIRHDLGSRKHFVGSSRRGEIGNRPNCQWEIGGRTGNPLQNQGPSPGAKAQNKSETSSGALKRSSRMNAGAPTKK